MRSLAAAIFIPLVTLATAGCHYGNARQVQLESAIPGLVELSYDGLNLHVEHDSTSETRLHVRGAPINQADLRLGGQFLITDGTVHNYYKVMLLDDGLITLKQTRFVDGIQERKGYRRTERVIAVIPYGDDSPGPAFSPRPDSTPGSE